VPQDTGGARHLKCWLLSRSTSWPDIGLNESSYVGDICALLHVFGVGRFEGIAVDVFYPASGQYPQRRVEEFSGQGIVAQPPGLGPRGFRRSGESGEFRRQVGLALLHGCPLLPTDSGWARESNSAARLYQPNINLDEKRSVAGYEVWRSRQGVTRAAGFPPPWG